MKSDPRYLAGLMRSRQTEKEVSIQQDASALLASTHPQIRNVWRYQPHQIL